MHDLRPRSDPTTSHPADDAQSVADIGFMTAAAEDDEKQHGTTHTHIPRFCPFVCLSQILLASSSRSDAAVDSSAMESPTPFVRSPLPFPLSTADDATQRRDPSPSPPYTPFGHRPHAAAAAPASSSTTSLIRRRGEWFRNLFDLLQKAVALLLCCIFISIRRASSSSSSTSSSNSNGSSTSSSPLHSSFRRKTSDSSSTSAAGSSAESGSNARRVPPIGMGSLDQTRLQQPHQVTYYEILLVSSSASAADIKQSHRRLAIRYHPDKYAVALSADAKSKSASQQQQARLSPAQAQAMFIQIQAAYECLSNPVERQRYDYALRTKTRYKKLAGPAPSQEDEADPASPSPAPSTMSSSASCYSTAYSTAQSTASSTRRHSFFGDEGGQTNFSSTASTARSSRRNSLSSSGAMLLLPLALLDVFVLRPLRRRLPAPLRLPSLLPRFRIPSPLGMLRRMTALMALGVYCALWIPLRCLLVANALRRWLLLLSGSLVTPAGSKASSPVQHRRKMDATPTPTSTRPATFDPRPAPASEPRDFPFVRVAHGSDADVAVSAAAAAAAAADTTSSESSPSLSTSPSVASAISMESMMDESAPMQRRVRPQQRSQQHAKASFLSPASSALHSLSDAECEGSDEGDEDWSSTDRPSGLAVADGSSSGCGPSSSYTLTTGCGGGNGRLKASASMPSLAQSEDHRRSATDGW